MLRTTMNFQSKWKSKFNNFIMNAMKLKKRHFGGNHLSFVSILTNKLTYLKFCLYFSYFHIFGFFWSIRFGHLLLLSNVMTTFSACDAIIIIIIWSAQTYISPLKYSRLNIWLKDLGRSPFLNYTLQFQTLVDSYIFNISIELSYPPKLK